MENQEKDDKKRNGIGTSFHSKGFRTGAYMTFVTALVIIAVIAVNLIVSVLDVTADLTEDGKYSITEETKEMLKDVKDDVTVYYLTKNGEKIEWLETILEAMKKETRKLSVKDIDTVLNPKFASQYTLEEVSQHSLVVVNENTKISRYIPYKDMLLTERSFDPQTYDFKEDVVGIDIEGQLYSAIHYVASGKMTNFYAVTGHEELELETEGQARLRKANINYQKLSLPTTAQIPEDCDVLYISQPKTDYTAEQLEVIRAYTAKGGKLLIAVGYGDDLINLNELLSDYQVTISEGVVIEGDTTHHLPNYPYVLIPVIGTKHEITSSISNAKQIVLYLTYETEVSATLPENITATTLLSSSEKSYLRRPVNGEISSLTKEDGDKGGPLRTAVLVSDSNNGSEAIISGCNFLFLDSYMAVASYGNADFMTNSVNYLSEKEATATIRSIRFDSEDMLTITAAEANAIAIVFSAIIPVILIAIGVVIMARRKKR